MFSNNNRTPNTRQRDRHPVQRLRGVMHALEKLLVRRPPLAFRTGMQHHVLTADQRGGLTRGDEFHDGGFAIGVDQRGDVDALGKRRVERNRIDVQGPHPLAGTMHVTRIVIVQMLRKRTDLDLPESRRPHRVEHVEDALPVETAGGKRDGPFIHREVGLEGFAAGIPVRRGFRAPENRTSSHAWRYS